MPKNSNRYNYKSVTLPESMLIKVNEHLKEYPEFGYGSIADFVKNAIRNQIEKDTKATNSYPMKYKRSYFYQKDRRKD